MLRAVTALASSSPHHTGSQRFAHCPHSARTHPALPHSPSLTALARLPLLLALASPQLIKGLPNGAGQRLFFSFSHAINAPPQRDSAAARGKLAARIRAVPDDKLLIGESAIKSTAASSFPRC